MNFDCKNIRKDILMSSHASGNGHIPTCFSVVELIYAIYGTMNHDPKNPKWHGRDLFVLSKGHASLALYCILARLGYFPTEDLKTFGLFSSRYGCHTDRTKIPGVEVSTGSLGHGIGVAVGMALALKLDKSSRRVYAIIGDGESNEGSVWEAIMVSTNLKLDNLTILLDYNHSQVRSLQLENFPEKFRAFGCDTLTVNGHNLTELKDALSKPSNTVKVIIANTIKGYGCRTLSENMFEWHRKAPNDEELQILLKELEESS
jgi:transketolase